MKRTFYSILSFCIILLFAIGIANSTATKVVLIEQYTGAWCGYCVDGTVRMDEIIEANPGKVLGVKFHNGDKMAIPETDTLGAALPGMTGFPKGNVDRTFFNVGGSPVIMIDRGAWAQATDAVKNTPGIADIKLQWSYDQLTNKITATISSKFDQSVSEELRFNVYITEDDCTGSGSGWDQSNYFDASAGHPYYGLGNPVKNYHHMKVVRALMGGTFGQPNSIPGPISAGSSANYIFEMTKKSDWNIDNIKLIGVVSYYTPNNVKIMNAALGEKVSSDTKISSTGDPLFVKPKNDFSELSIDIKNSGTSTKEYTLSLAKAPGTTWNASIEPNEYVISIPASQTYNVKFRMTVTSTGSGQATLNIQETDGMIFSKSLKGYSSDLTQFHVMVDPASDVAGLGNLIKSFPEYTQIQAIPPSDFSTLYSKFPDIKLVVYNAGSKGTIPATENSVIQSLINKKVNLLFTGGQVFSSFNQNLQQIAGQLGIAWQGACFQGQSTGNFNMEGIDSDPISNGFSSQFNYSNGDILMNKARITDPSIASKVITLKGNTDTVLAVKTQLPNSKAVVLGFQPMGIQNSTQRSNLVYNALKWVYASQPAEIPTITTPTGISFDEVATDKTAEKSFKIQNTGKKDLVISKVELVNNSDGAYAITDYGKSTITPGDSTFVTIKFAPSAIKFYSTTTVEISSNDPNKPKAVVQLSGKGGKPGNVLDNQIIRLNVSPNPIEQNGTIKFVIPDFAKSTSLRIVDINGKTILNLGNSFSFGENSVSFDSQLLNAGNYLVVLTINDENVNYKFTVIK